MFALGKMDPHGEMIQFLFPPCCEYMLWVVDSWVCRNERELFTVRTLDGGSSVKRGAAWTSLKAFASG